MLARIFSASTFSLISRFFSTSTNLVIMFFISRFMTARDLGEYGIAFFFFQFFIVISYFGLETFTSREVAYKREDPAELKRLFRQVLDAVVYGTLLSLVFLALFCIFYHRLSFTLLLLTLVTGVLYGFDRNLGAYLLGQEKIQVNSFFMTLSFLLNLALLILIRHNLSLENIFLFRASALFCSVAGQALFIRRRLPIAKISAKFRQFKEVAYFWALTVVVFLERQIDVFILSWFIDETLLGGYFLSLRIYLTINLLIEVLAQAQTPFISRVFRGQEKTQLKTFFRYLFIFSILSGLLLGVFLFFTRDYLISLFSPDLIPSASPFLLILSFMVPFKMGIYLLGAVLSSSRYQKLRFHYSLFLTFLFVIALFPAVRLFGAPGAVWARAGFEIVTFCVSLFYVLRMINREEGGKPGQEKKEKKKLAVAIIGSRGYPYVYSGYETFVKELSGGLVKKDIAVTVYCHRNLFKERPARVNGIDLVYIPTIEKKSLSQFIHSFQAAIHACFRPYDLILAVNSANGPFGLFFRLAGKKSIINVDGLEWLRPKWKGLGSKYFYWASRLATRFYDAVVTDSLEMQKIYQKEFNCPSHMIAYGAHIRFPQDGEPIAKWGLEKHKYYLIVGRLIPDNNADLIVREFISSRSHKKLVIVGDVPYRDTYAQKIKAVPDPRLVFTGYVTDPDELAELYHHCFAYFHGHEFGGTNPAMLKALAYGCAILALDTVFNREMLVDGRYGLFFSKQPGHLQNMIDQLEKSPASLTDFRARSRERIAQAYTWEKVVSDYIQLFHSLQKKG